MTVSTTDTAGHFGGLITGILCGMWILPKLEDRPKQPTFGWHNNTVQPKEEANNDFVKNLGYILTGIWFVLQYTLFYTVREPVNVYQ